MKKGLLFLVILVILWTGAHREPTCLLIAALILTCLIVNELAARRR